jgi:hypothetical protein
VANISDRDLSMFQAVLTIVIEVFSPITTIVSCWKFIPFRETPPYHSLNEFSAMMLKEQLFFVQFQ